MTDPSYPLRRLTSSTWLSAQLHYRGILEDGTEFDSSRDRDEPVSFLVGMGQIFGGVDAAVLGVSPGGTGRCRLEPNQAFGVPPCSQLRSPEGSAEVLSLDYHSGGALENGISGPAESVPIPINCPLCP